MRVLKIIGKAAVSFYDELFYYMLFGLIHLLCWVLVLPGPFALAGMYTVGQKTVRGLGVKWHIIWEGVKEFGLRSFLLFLIIIFVYVVIGLNVWFYSTPEVSPFPARVAVWTTPLFLFLGLIWTGVAFYAQSFLMELQEPTWKLIFRNSLFLTLLQPFQTLGLLLVSAVALGLSIALPVLLIVWPGFVSCLSLTAVRQLIAHLTEKAEALKSTDEAGEGEEDEGLADEGLISDGDDDDRA